MSFVEELTNWPEYVKIFVGIFALVPPPIVVPLYLGVMAGRSIEEKLTAAKIGAFGFFITMIAFTHLGSAILGVFGISLPAFRLAGGFLLLLIALDMLRASPDADDAQSSSNRGTSALALGIVPISIPFLAGPGAISAIVLFASDHDSVAHRILVSIVIFAVAILIWLILRIAAYSEKLFSPNVALVFNKVMGLIIAAIAFEFVMDGIAGHFPQLETLH